MSDCIVIGAGSAGCVLANRLSVDLEPSVGVSEAEPSLGGIGSWPAWSRHDRTSMAETGLASNDAGAVMLLEAKRAGLLPSMGPARSKSASANDH